MVITGTAWGIGKATAIRAAKEGANVVCADILAEEGQAVVDEIINNGGKAIFVEADVRKEKDVKTIFKITKETYGHIHHAVNNAGRLCDLVKLHEMDSTHFEDIINNNLKSVFYCCKEEINAFLEQGSEGSIVNVASVTGIVGTGKASAYIASKHGVNGLTKSVAFDYARQGIRCNSICPAGTDTKLYRDAGQSIMMKVQEMMMAGKSQEEAMMAALPGGKPENTNGKVAAPADQAATILYLLSDEASHMTGSIVATDGGVSTY